MYWMVSNLNRDSTRRYVGLNSGLKISPSSLCEADRSSLGLFVSPNLVDWHFVDLLAYSADLHHHYAYPHAIVDGDSILVVCRSHPNVPGASRPVGLAGYKFSMKSRNHDSSAIAFLRVKGFRTLVDLEWASHVGQWEAGGGGGGWGSAGRSGEHVKEEEDPVVEPPEVRLE